MEVLKRRKRPKYGNDDTPVVSRVQFVQITRSNLGNSIEAHKTPDLHVEANLSVRMDFAASWALYCVCTGGRRQLEEDTV